MTVSNKTNQTDIILRHVDRINNGSHKALEDNEFSVTQLLKDATAIILGIRHRNEISLDVQDLADQTGGTDQHESLREDAEALGYLCEQELSYHFQFDKVEFTLYGKLDFYRPSDGTLIDYKTSKEATYNKNASGEDDEWKRQTTLYYTLLEFIKPSWYTGVNKMLIQSKLGDVSVVSNDKKGESTDKYRLINFRLPTLMERTDELRKAVDKVREVKSLWGTPDDKLPICSAKFRYATTEYKIYKRKGENEHLKTAERGHAHYPTAKDAVEGFHKAGFTDKTHVILECGGESLKCRYFCDVAKFCPHYRKMMEDRND